MSVALAKAGATEFYAARFADLRARLPGNGIAWLDAAREQPLQAFTRLGFPTTRDEAWKYSNLALLERRQYAPISTSVLADPARIAQHDVCGGHLLVFVSGQFAPALSRLPAGTAIASLAQVLQQDADAVRDAIAIRREPADGLAALNAAFFADGACVRLAPGTQLDAPIHLLFVAATL